jgi:hypothetical protein
MVGGIAISVMMTPFDLIMTRLYNQRESEDLFSLQAFIVFPSFQLLMQTARDFSTATM